MLVDVSYQGVILPHRVVLTAVSEITALQLCRDLGLSKQGIARVFARKQLMCDGQPLARESHIAAGSEVLLDLYVADVPSACPDVSPARILWHDRFVLAAKKPAGMLVHGDGTGVPTLTDAVHAAIAQEDALQSVVPQALQRLDVPTSGIVLFSRGQPS